MNELRGVLGNDIQVETLMGFTPASSSPDTSLFGILRDVSQQHVPGASVTPAVMGGIHRQPLPSRPEDYGVPATRRRWFPLEDAGGVHGNNERISVDNIRRGVLMMRDIVWRFAVN